MDIASTSFVLGYHGCDRAVATRVLAGRTALQVSHNDYDWLGDGVYFWEHNTHRAYEFACEVARRPHPSGQHIHHPAVVGAVIDLRFCLNLLDSRFIAMVREAHELLVASVAEAGIELPRNVGGDDLLRRNLDCAVLRTLHRSREATAQIPFDTVRAAFTEGGPLYDNAGFAAKTHIQLCVRDRSCIKGYFRPLDERGRLVRFD